MPLTNETRPLTRLEAELRQVLQPLLRGEEEALPDQCEVEPGYFLRLILDTWSIGGNRDGRKGHLTDADIASELETRTGERFDRNRYQAMFGLGKKMADGTRQPQPVSRTVAKALLEIALKNWDQPPEDSGRAAPDMTPFPQVDSALLDVAINNALKEMYRDGREVRCRDVVGLGWYGLYRELGAGSYSVAVIARDDALRMRDNNDIFVLSKLLHLLLCNEKGRSADARHIWVIRRPCPSLERHTLVRELDGIGMLKSRLRTIEYLNLAAPEGWTPVDLDRCVVAETTAHSAHSDLFDLALSEQGRADAERSEEPIAVLAISPDREVRFFTFSFRRSPGLAPFLERFDLPGAANDQILQLVDEAKTVSGDDDIVVAGDWRYRKAMDFAKNWYWQIGGNENQ